MAGFSGGDPYGRGGPPIAPTGPPLPTSQFGNPSTFTAAAKTQASDYDTIMKQYGDILTKNAASPLVSNNVSYQGIPAQSVQYQQSGDVTNSLANLSDLAATGGYTPQGIADIRARDISPTRSIYANAQQNAERARALSGGYSPNFNATQRQMARDESNQIANIDTAANAGIAQNVATNRISAASPYASASSAANAAKTAADQKAVDVINQINEANANNNLQAKEFNSSQGLQAQVANRQNILGASQGMTSLYGTTPALTSTFGNQVGQAANIGQGQQQINDQRQRNILAGR
jgi:hypothetical protein